MASMTKRSLTIDLNDLPKLSVKKTLKIILDYHSFKGKISKTKGKKEITITEK